MGFFDFLRSFFTDSSSNSGLDNKIRNPILRSAGDITKDLIRRIIDNDLDSLTIDYEFTRAPDYDRQKWRASQCYTNPFYRANKCTPIKRILFYRAKKCTPIKRIEFKVILTRNVTSLAGAFADM